MKITGLHLELTNKCTLKCPKCARTTFVQEFGQKNWQNQDLNLAHLTQFLTGVDLTGSSILLCGNDGDPLYYPDLFPLVQWFKSQNAKIVMMTNGSYMKQAWWEQLVSLMDSDDEIMFSIDGLPENFTTYRINADWKSIEVGIKVVTASEVKSTWKFIPFKFNQDDLEKVQSLAKEYGFSRVMVDPSDRWEDHDEFKPTRAEFVRSNDESRIQWKASKSFGADYVLDPKCAHGDRHYISAAGFYSPCCYIGDYHFYYKSEFYKNRDQYNISKWTLVDILGSDSCKNFYSSIESMKLPVCTFNCAKI